MLVRYFRWETDDEYGTDGWKPIWIPNANVGSPMTIAHDTLEHSLTDDGSLEHELMALGSMFYVRGRDEDNYWDGLNYYTIRDPIVHFSSDCEMLLERRLHDDGDAIRPAPCPNPPLRDRDVEEYLREAVWRAVRHAEALWSDNKKGGAALPPQERENMVDWLRLGWRRARKRFRECPSPADLFRLIENGVEDIGEAEFGQLLTVCVSIRKCKASLVVSNRFA